MPPATIPAHRARALRRINDREFLTSTSLLLIFSFSSTASRSRKLGGGPYGHLTVAIVVSREARFRLFILYVDEAGDLGSMPATPAPTGNDQPVVVVGGLIIDAHRLEQFTQEFLNLKSRWFPGLPYPSNRHLDKIIPEIKGADVRRNATRGTRRQHRHAIGFLDHLIQLFQKHNIRLIARIWIKPLGQPFIGRSVYTSSIQALYSYFDHWLGEQGGFGFYIADSRDYQKNANVAHSIFTQKYQMTSSLYGRILDLPSFSHSENHAGLQACDILCSALLFPIATGVYCTGYIQNVHVQAGSETLRQRFSSALKAMQYRYQEPTGRWIGGIVVSDMLTGRSGKEMFQP